MTVTIPPEITTAEESFAIVQLAQAGDMAAFGLLYERYYDVVFRFIYFRVGNRPLAEDLTQDAFSRALKRITSFTWQGKDVGAWFITIARNLVADHFKSGRYRLEITSGDVLDADGPDRAESGPEGATVDYLSNVELLTAVMKLGDEQRECLVLRFLRGYSVAETAEAMGKNTGAIKALQYRAVRTLARNLPAGFDGRERKPEIPQLPPMPALHRIIQQRPATAADRQPVRSHDDWIGAPS